MNEWSMCIRLALSYGSLSATIATVWIWCEDQVNLEDTARCSTVELLWTLSFALYLWCTYVPQKIFSHIAYAIVYEKYNYLMSTFCSVFNVHCERVVLRLVINNTRVNQPLTLRRRVGLSVECRIEWHLKRLRTKESRRHVMAKRHLGYWIACLKAYDTSFVLKPLYSTPLPMFPNYWALTLRLTLTPWV